MAIKLRQIATFICSIVNRTQLAATSHWPSGNVYNTSPQTIARTNVKAFETVYGNNLHRTWVFLFAETFRSFVQNSLKASVSFFGYCIQIRTMTEKGPVPNSFIACD